MRTDQPLRGQVYWVGLPGIGRKPAVVVSNNRRNLRLDSVLVARITSRPKPDVPTIVHLPRSEPIDGCVVCDDVALIPKGALGEPIGGLSPPTMLKVSDGLRIALGLA